MKKIKLIALTAIGGYAGLNVKAGETFELSERRAVDLIAAGSAIEVKPKEPKQGKGGKT